MKTVHPLPLRYLTIAAAVSFVCHSVYALPVAPTASPFAATSPNMVAESTKTSGNNVKPNVMLLVDDSGSMNESVDGRVADYSHPSKMELVRSALNKVLSEQGNKIHWNLNTLWGTHLGHGLNYQTHYITVNQKVVPASTHGYLTAEQLRPFVNNMRPYGYTPTTSRYLKSADYAINEIKYACQKNFIVLLSDGDANDGGPFDSSDLPQYLTNFNTYGDFDWYWRSGYCNATRENTKLRTGISRPVLRPWICTGDDNLPRPYSGDKKWGLGYFSKKLYDTDLKTTGTDAEGSKWDGKQNIQTYTVGFGNGMSKTGLNYLKNAGQAPAGVQTYYKADNADELNNAFSKIFSAIGSQVGVDAVPVASTATPSNASATDVNGAAASVTLDTSIWTSDLILYKLDSKGALVKGQSYSPSYGGRTIIYNNGNKNSILSPDNYADFGFVKSRYSRYSDEFTNSFLPWYERDPNESDEQIEAAAVAANYKPRIVSAYRKRTDTATNPKRMMGDVLDANTLTIGEGAKYIVLGANDGMVYMFKQDAGNKTSYHLEANYLPGAQQRESETETLASVIPAIAESNYGTAKNPHIYGINGGMTYATTFPVAAGGVERPRQTFMLANLGQGGRGAVALNIAGNDLRSSGKNPVGLDGTDYVKTVPLWETRQGIGGQMLGYTISAPAIYPVSKQWNGDKADLSSNMIQAAFIANGYRSANKSLPYDSGPTLYVYDALGLDVGVGNVPVSSSGSVAGTLVKKIETTDNAGAALATPLVVDTDFNGVADVAYAGDNAGDLWRFDLRGAPSTWQAVKIYDGEATQPITASPSVYRKSASQYIVLFGTGSDIYSSDSLDQNQQMFAGVYDDLSKIPASPATKSTMLKQDLVSNAAANPASRTVSKNMIDTNTQRGWYIPLAAGSVDHPAVNTTLTTSAEKVSTKATVLQKTAYFTTRIYKTKEVASGNQVTPGAAVESCKTSSTESATNGKSWLMAIDIESGSMPTTSKLKDTNGTGRDIAGYELDSLAGAVVVFNTGSIGGTEESIGVNGDIGAGVQVTPTATPTPKDNQCLGGGDYSIYAGKANIADPLLHQGITVDLCNSRLIRLNSRIIREN